MGMDLLRMEWRDVGFMHWPVDPDRVAETLPPGVSVDTHDGDAYLGVVPFRMTDIRPRGSPVGLSFCELNLRTYVRADGTPGVYFYNLDADDRYGVGIARQFFRLPYYRAEMQVASGDDAVRFRSRRPGADPAARFDGRYGPVGDPETPAAGSLAAFLVERYRFYTASEGGQVYYADISHAPWPLADGWAEIDENGLFAANGLDEPAGEPLVHYSPGIDVTAERLRRL